MKKYLFLTATAALALASCSSDNYIGEDPENIDPTKAAAISFDGGTGVITRAAKTGNEAATALNNKFVVYGWKTQTVTPTKQVVYDHYTINWGGAPGSTTSNSAGWEYVGQDLNMLTSLTKDENKQEIKYCDFAATQYDFIAFSTGDATQVAADATPTTGQVAVSQINNTPTYTIKGATEDLAKVYIADRVSALPSTSGKTNLLYQYKNAIQFNFRSLASKVRIGLYETIPGYSVKNVNFYAADASKSGTPKLYAADKNIPGGMGTMTVTFGPNDDPAKTDYNKAYASFAPTVADPTTNTADLTFGAISLRAKDKLETTDGDVFLGRTSVVGSGVDNVSICDYVNVLPAVAGALTLKVDFTLESRDGSGEMINVVGASAVVPAQYCTWQPNYAYTYLFKITDKVSVDQNQVLYPITFDAIVTQAEDGIQETITEVIQPSITTYQAGKVVTVNNEYTAGNIYVVVEGTPALTEETNYNLYTATVEADALQGITEASVENCLINAKTYTAVADKATMTAGTVYYTSNKGAGKFEATAENLAALKADANTYYTASAVAATGPWTVYDAAGKALTLTLANGVVEPATKILATDSPTGDDLTINCATITASTSTVYVFEYFNGVNKTYKVIKVQ